MPLCSGNSSQGSIFDTFSSSTIHFLEVWHADAVELHLYVIVLLYSAGFI